MDFRQTTQSSSRPTPSGASSPLNEDNKVKISKLRARDSRWFKILNAVILLGVAILIAAVALAVARGDNGNESKYVNHKKYQAVFLNNGQVYFGNITSLNNKYVHLSNIYYLTQSSSDSSNNSSNGNYSLVKLGCQQIHDPYDEMVINRDQVTFWENLQDSGKVVTSINQFIKQNPKGPDCSQVSTQTQASGGTNAQGSTATNNTTTKK